MGVDGVGEVGDWASEGQVHKRERTNITKDKKK
jgi:hypothetical protein